MRLEQGSICDYCKNVMKPYVKFTISYRCEMRDTSYKICKTSANVTMNALDLCPDCMKKVCRSIESRAVTYSSKDAFKRFMHRCFVKKSLNKES